MTRFLDADRLASGVSATAWGPVSVVPATASTNADVARQARAGAPHGFVLATPHQTAGRGRFDRVWTTPPDTCVALSVLVRPRRPLADWGWLSLLVGMAVVDGVAAASGVRARLKWPNDVLIDERKVCGILSEAVDTPTGWAAVLGMGINVTLSEADLVVPTATSLAIAGSTAPAAEVVAAVLAALDGWYRRWESGFDVADAYRARCDTLGRRVSVLLPDGPVPGVAEDVDADGGLVVRTEEGLRTFAAGDVTHLRPGH